jgi:hypothetical protein
MMDDPEDNRKKKNEHMDIVRQRRDELYPFCAINHLKNLLK